MGEHLTLEFWGDDDSQDMVPGYPLFLELLNVLKLLQMLAKTMTIVSDPDKSLKSPKRKDLLTDQKVSRHFLLCGRQNGQI